MIRNDHLMNGDLDALASDLACSRRRAEVIRSKGRKTVLRVRLDEHHTIVAKLWALTRAMHKHRRLTRTSTALREYRVLGHLHRAGIAVPEPFGYWFVRTDSGPSQEVILMHDLGPCMMASTYLHDLVTRQDWSRQIALDNEIVAMTRGVVDAGVVDPDHSVNNIVVDERRQLFRVDLEMAGRHRRGRFFSTRYAMMLGRLIESYTYAVQPHVELSLAFCDRLARELRPSRVARSRAAAFVARRLDRQRRTRGIDTRLALRW